LVVLLSRDVKGELRSAVLRPLEGALSVVRFSRRSREAACAGQVYSHRVVGRVTTIRIRVLRAGALL